MENSTSSDDSRGSPPAGPGWRAEGADLELLARFARLLEQEALPAGAIGPSEASRLHDRHLHDSLGFAVAWQGEAAPEGLIDVGSGAGLPGIPLAILWPECEVRLVERSGRRARFLRRAARVLGLDSVSVVESGIEQLDPELAVGAPIVMRAVFAPEAVPARLAHLNWERLVVASGEDDHATWGERRRYRVFARVGWVRTMRHA